MKIGRREFILSAGLSTLGFSTRSFGAEQVPLSGKPGLPIVQTLTDDTSAQFVVLASVSRKQTYRARRTDGRELPLVRVSRVLNPFETDVALDHLLVEGLWPGEDYLLEVFEGPSPKLVDQRTFRAFDTRPRATRIAIASCMADVLSTFQGAMWKSMADCRPEAIFLIGDTCYADILTDGSVRGRWKRHLQTRRALDTFKWKRLVPVYATWDDHDYGGNNSDKNYKYKAQSLETFKAMWGWNSRGPACEGPGVSSYVEFCGQRYFLTDDRYFRDSRKVAGGLHWGRAQEEWLFRGLASDARPAWIMNGSQFFGGYLGKESFESDQPANLRDVGRTLSSIEAPVMLASGDVHFSEVMRVEREQFGYETYELTSSSIHSATWPGNEEPGKNKRRLVTTWHHNFLLVDSRVEAGGELAFKTYAVAGKQHVHFDHAGRLKRVK